VSARVVAAPAGDNRPAVLIDGRRYVVAYPANLRRRFSTEPASTIGTSVVAVGWRPFHADTA
jgi:hypothetical protein